MTAAVTLASMGNGPAFRAYFNGTQNPSGSTWTKATLNTKSFDTNNNFNTATYTFTPTVAGYYLFSGLGYATGSPPECYMQLRMNNSGVVTALFIGSGTSQWTGVINDVLYANGTTDYFELYIYSAAGSPAFSSLRLSGSLLKAA